MGRLNSGMPEAIRTGPRGREAVTAAVIAATIELLAEGGYGDVTIKGIGDRAGVNAGLVFLYFGSKEALVHEALAEALSRLRRSYALAIRSQAAHKALGLVFEAERISISFIISAALAPLAAPLRVDIGAIVRRIAGAISPGRGAPAEREAESLAFDLVAMGLGYSLLDRVGRRRGEAASDYVAGLFPRGVEAVRGGGDRRRERP